MTDIATQLQERLKRFLGYLEADPKNYPLLTEAADICLDLADVGQARLLLERAGHINDQNPQWWYQMAILCFLEQDFESSLSYTEKILNSGEQNPQVRLQHARTLVFLGRYDQAERFLAELNDAIENQQIEPIAGLSDIYVRALHHLGKIDEAIELGERVSMQEPDNSRLQGMLSLLYLDQNELQKARDLSESVLSKEPDNLDALITAGSTALAYEEQAKAEQYFEKALMASPNNGRIWLGLALSSMFKGDLNTAKTQMQHTVDTMPEHLGSWNTLAWIDILQNDLSGAKATLQKSLAINDKFGESYGSLAVVAAFEEKWEEANELCKKSLRLQSDSFAGRFAQSLLVAHRGRPEQAQAMVKGILENFALPGGGNLADMVRRYIGRQAGAVKKSEPVLKAPNQAKTASQQASDTLH